MRRTVRLLALSAACLLAGFVALCCMGEIRQRILVHRGERLLMDIHALRLHQSTWADAQRLMTRWGRWGHYDGQCTAADCMYVVTLENGTVGNGGVAEWPTRTSTYINALRLLPRQWGGGLRQLQGMFLVQDGRVVRSGLAIDMTVSPMAQGVQPSCCGDELIISVLSRPSLGNIWQQEEVVERHPDYRVWKPGGCSFCLMGRVFYADSIASEEATRLSNFQLSCATRWTSCLTLEQLDPAAREWHLYGPPWGEAPEYVESRVDASPYCHIPLYARARDAESVFMVRALEDPKDEIVAGDGNAGLKRGTLDLVSVLKDEGSHQQTGPVEGLAHGRELEGSQIGRPVVLTKGRQYLLVVTPSDAPPSVEGKLHLGPCEVVAWTPLEEQEIRRGIALVNALRGPEPSISLHGFSRDPAFAGWF